MKNLFLKSMAVALLLTATATTINAQPPRPEAPEMEQSEKGKRGGERAERVEKTPEEKAAAITEAMTSRLSLSESQAKKLYNINLDYLVKMEELKTLESKRDLNVLDILDDDQSIIYLDMLSASKRGGPQGQGAPDKKDIAKARKRAEQQ